MNQNPLEQLHQLAKTMENKLEKVANKLSQLPKTPQAGDIFRIDNQNTLGLLQWVLLYSQSKQWFIVPADDNPIAGSTDIAISEKALCGPLTLRCSQGIWIAETNLNLNLRVGVLENWHLYRAIDKTKQVFEGKIQSTVWQRETEADPEYDEWMEQVIQERQALKQHKKTLVNLKKWFQNDFVDSIKTGWQELNKIPINVAFMPVRTMAIKRAKLINLGKYYTVVLVLDIRKFDNQNTEVIFWLCAAGEQTTLPKNLKFALLDRSSGIDREKTANGTEKYLNIKWSFSVKEEFCIAIQLDDVSFTESFML
jgi:hypothetical protein